MIKNLGTYRPSLLNEVITAKEAAKILGVTPRQVQNMCKTGKLDCRYADGVWLVLKSSVRVDNTTYHIPDNDQPKFE